MTRDQALAIVGQSASQRKLAQQYLSARVRHEQGCWLWTGSTTRKGYAEACFLETTLRAHRLSYTAFVGPIPAGLTIDHKCRVRHCVNPEHLEPVTNRENLHRGISANRLKTHCRNGHEYAGANLRFYVSREGHKIRLCRECDRIRSREYRARASA